MSKELTKREILEPLIAEIGYSYSNLKYTEGHSNDLLEIAEKAMEEYAKIKLAEWQAQQPIKEQGWVSKKPVFTEDCILLTATKIRGEWNYNSCTIKKIYGEDDKGNAGWYWAWCTMDGDEYDDINELVAEKYKIIPQIK